MSQTPFPPPPEPAAPSAPADGAVRAPSPALSLMAAMDVQDQLLIVHHDMDRLRTLLADAGATLMDNFHELSTMMFRRQGGGAPPGGQERRRTRESAPDAAPAARSDSPFRHSDFAESQFGLPEALADDPALAPVVEAVEERRRSGDPSQRQSDRERAEALMLRIVTALQFQDMANQLIEHACNRLRSSADRIARDIMSGDGDEPAEAAYVEDPPMRPNPVTQDEMDAGSVELF
ncbi:hypothetical protein [Amphibiibacter pelophylacis]|uniref:Uncharacterized protein n=1 Tax=Amphibiibacter pelophylacis TaxID=1799477 RepID=A0ACC6P213_9BURK